MRQIRYILLVAITLASLHADTSSRTSFTFSSDEDGNLYPTLFIPVYYGDNNQFFSRIGYTSFSYKDISSVNSFDDSKDALVSSSKELLVNYISYKTALFGFDVSVGAQSVFSHIDNNEFGYIHDSANLFGNGSDYYISFDNEIALDIQQHALRGDIFLPFGDYLNSRLSTSISPFTIIGVKQSTIFKPLVSETGTSSSKTTQELAYNFLYELRLRTGTFVDFGALASYSNQPLKYDLAQLATSGSSYVFDTNTVDTIEVKSSYLVKLIFNIKIMGGLNPSIGYGVKSLDMRNNVTHKSISSEKKFFAFGFEKRF